MVSGYVAMFFRGSSCREIGRLSLASILMFSVEAPRNVIIVARRRIRSLIFHLVCPVRPPD